jgi:hypothetical protein
MKTTLLAVFVVSSLSAVAFADAAGGVSWTVPGAWKSGEARPMRAATYAVPAAKDVEGGECAVFFFGPGQGGSIDDNVRRWVGQFEGGKAAPSRKEKVNGVEVTRVEVDGTFQSGGMAGPPVAKPGFKLLGAIVEGKEGNVFFKFTGPAKTVEAARKDFEAMLKSLKK